MNFDNGIHFAVFKDRAKANDIEEEKELSDEEILNSNNVETIAKYAKENRSKAAIDKVRELLELSRTVGEGVVQNFLNSFIECEKEKIAYLDFESTESGKIALGLLEKIPEPFKTKATKKLEDYKKELKQNTELFEKHKNNPEEIWKEVFGFDYYKIPAFKERFKTFLFTDIGAVSDKYYKKNALDAKQDPFAINFFIEDQENFDRAYGKSITDAHDKFGGFSKRLGESNINVINEDKSPEGENIRVSSDEISAHETEHAVHRSANVMKASLLDPEAINETANFKINKNQINNSMRFDFEERLKKAKDEIFAYLKGGANKESAETLLIDKDVSSLYDYNKEGRDLNNKLINKHKYFSEVEKKKLKASINFLQSEYDRVLKNMVELIYQKNQSVEFFRNVPINELWKYSNGKYSRTDFIIKKFKF